MKVFKLVPVLSVVAVIGLWYQTAFAQPSISDIRITRITENTARIEWTTAISGSSDVNFGVDSNLRWSVSKKALTTNHSVTLANLNSGTQYLFEVQSTDADGNKSIDNNDGDLHSFTTAKSEDVTRAFVGVATAIDDASLTLVREGSGQMIVMLLSEDLILKMPGGSRAGEFEVGARIVVLAELLENDEWLGLRVLVKPGKPNPPKTGVVVGVVNNAITVIETGGITETFELESNVANPDVGDLVTVFLKSNGKANGLVKSQEVRLRVQAFLEDIVEDELNLSAKQIDLLAKALEKHGNQELRYINEALSHAPEDKKPDLLEAKDEVTKGRQVSLLAMERAKSKANGNGDSSSQ